jgi:hypothetical protein
MIAGGLALFLTLLVVLAWQVRSGRDPALGAARQQPALVAQAPRRVVVRKVVRRVILEKVVEPDDGGGTALAVVPAGPSVQAPPQVVYAAPAAAPAPAPSAPVVTKTS